MTQPGRAQLEAWQRWSLGVEQPTVSNSGASPVVDASVGEVFVLTLNAPTVTVSAVNPRAVGDRIYVVAIQDQPASRTLAWASNFRNAPTGSGSAGQRASFEFRWDGVSWQCVGGSTAFA